MTTMTHPALPAFDATVVEQSVSFSFYALCQACSSSQTQVLALVDEGILDPSGQGPADWVFHGSALRTARTALRLSNELQLGLAGTALVLDLLAEIHTLRARLHRAG